MEKNIFTHTLTFEYVSKETKARLKVKNGEIIKAEYQKKNAKHKSIRHIPNTPDESPYNYYMVANIIRTIYENNPIEFGKMHKSFNKGSVGDIEAKRSIKYGKSKESACDYFRICSDHRLRRYH